MTNDVRIVLDAIRARYAPPDFIVFDELRHGVGCSGDDMGATDAFVMDIRPNKGLTKTAYEIKVSRSDFLRELKKPLKRRQAMLVSNYFYFIAPYGIIKPEDVPIDCGLQVVEECDPTKFDRSVWRIRTLVPAPYRDVNKPTWRFVASICRRVHAREGRNEEAS